MIIVKYIKKTANKDSGITIIAELTTPTVPDVGEYIWIESTAYEIKKRDWSLEDDKGGWLTHCAIWLQKVGSNE